MALELCLQASAEVSGLYGSSIQSVSKDSSFARSAVFGRNAFSSVRRVIGRRGLCMAPASSPALICVAVVWWSDAARQLREPDWQKAHLMRGEKLKGSSVSQATVDKEADVDYLLMWTETLKLGAKQLVAAGLTPGMVVGRTAMLGFFAATTVEFETGKSVLQQLTIRGELSSAVVAVAVALMSLALHEKYTKEDGSASTFNPFGLFTPTAERLNGQAAMLGFVLLVAIESAKGSALF